MMASKGDTEIKYRLLDQIWVCRLWIARIQNMVIAAMKLKDAYSLEGKLWPTQTAY